jgi:hypothetical protein
MEHRQRDLVDRVMAFDRYRRVPSALCRRPLPDEPQTGPTGDDRDLVAMARGTPNATRAATSQQGPAGRAIQLVAVGPDSAARRRNLPQDSGLQKLGISVESGQ